MAKQVDEVQRSFDEWIELSVNTRESQRATSEQRAVISIPHLENNSRFPPYKKLNVLKMMPSPFTHKGHSDHDSLDLQNRGLVKAHTKRYLLLVVLKRLFCKRNVRFHQSLQNKRASLSS